MANLLTKVCNDVCNEPELQPIDGETLSGTSTYTQDGAKLDMATNCFWVVNLNALSLICDL